MNLQTLAWDDAMRALLSIPAQVLPTIRGSAEVYGTTLGMKSLPDGIPVSGMAGDQQAALFGQSCFAPGEAKCTYGTGAFLLMNTGSTPVRSTSGQSTYHGFEVQGQKRFSDGLSMLASYTWSRTIDYVSDPFSTSGGGLLNLR